MSDLYLYTARKNALLRLKQITEDLQGSRRTYGNRACVYATGSFGRLEAGAHSDLDLFIVTNTKKVGLDPEKSLLDSVDEIKLKYDLIRTAEKHKVAKFDGGGKFLTTHKIKSFTQWLGSDQDDVRNTLTGRMLMLLESKPLIGDRIYAKTINQVISKYFRDYAGHEDDFIPAFLFNDIMRMWRTFCVNYEFHRKEGDSRNKIKNLKLKFSRMLTCFSGIIYLLAIYSKQGNVSPDNIRTMIAISPTERLECIADKSFGISIDFLSSIQDTVHSAINSYSEFLELTHQDVNIAVAEYTKNEAEWRAKSYSFGHCLSTLIDELGKTSDDAGRLRRLIVI
jgi:hypothetical protein